MGGGGIGKVTCRGNDDIGHYAVCQCVQESLRRCKLPVPTSVLSLIGDEASNQEHFVLCCLLCSVLRAAHNQARLSQAAMTASDLDASIIARVKSICQNCDRTARIFRAWQASRR